MNPKEKSQIKREATSIKVDPELWKQAKIEAITRDMDLSLLVENALRKELRVRAPK
jgi:post-segregation antitoxin (ccd killing protein)